MQVKSFKELIAKSQAIVEAEGTQDLSDVIDVIFENYVAETGDEEGEGFDFGLTILSNFADRLPDDVAGDIAALLHDEFLEDDEELGDEDEDMEDDEEMGESFDEDGILIEKLVKIDVSAAAKKKRKEARLRYKKNRAKLRLKSKKYRKSAKGKKQSAKHAKAVKRAGGSHKGKRIVT